MKRIVKKVLAFVLAMTLLVTQLAMPAMAEDSASAEPPAETPAPQVTVTATVESPASAPAASPAPAPAASTSSAPAADLSADTSLPAAPADYSSSSSSAGELSGGGYQEVVTEQWQESTVTTPDPAPATITPPPEAPSVSSNPIPEASQGTDHNVTVENSGNTIVTEAGSQTTTTTYTGDGASREIVGEETITTTDTTKTVITETGTLAENDISTDGLVSADAEHKPEETEKQNTPGTKGSDPTIVKDTNKTLEELAQNNYIDSSTSGSSKTFTVTMNMPVTMTGSQSDIPANKDHVVDDSNKVSMTVDQVLQQSLPSYLFDNGVFRNDLNGKTIDTDNDGVLDTYVQYTYKNGGTGKENIASVTVTRANDPKADKPIEEKWEQTAWTDADTSNPGTVTGLDASRHQEYSEVTPTYTYKNGTPVNLPKVTKEDYAKAYENGKYTYEDVDANGNKVERTIILKDDKSGFDIIDKVILPGTEVDPLTQEISAEITPDFPVKPIAAAPKTENGVETKEKVEDITDQNGNLIGYRKTVTQTDASGRVSTQIHEYQAGQNGYTEIAPQKPTAAAPRMEEGLMVTEKVTEIKENGKVVGYRKTITKTIPDTGEEYYVETHDYLGGTQTYKENISVEMNEQTSERILTITSEVVGQTNTEDFIKQEQQLVDTIRDITQQLYQINGDVSEIYLQFEGTFYKVGITPGSDHGTLSYITKQEAGKDGKIVDVRSWQPNLRLDGGYKGSDTDPISIDKLIQGQQSYYTKKLNADEDTDLITAWRPKTENSSLGAGNDWNYYAYALEARGKLQENDNSHVVHQFVLRDKDNEVQVYAYCMDMNTSAKHGADYNMDNIKDSGYTADPKVAELIEAIAVNGFWGTAGDGKDANNKPDADGSLAYVKSFLKDQMKNGSADLKAKLSALGISEDDVDTYLSEGLAMIATQAALWYHGQTGDKKAASQKSMMDDGILSTDEDGDALNAYSMSNDENQNGFSAKEAAVTNALFRALVLQNPSKTLSADQRASEFLDTDNFATTTTIKINGTLQNISDMTAAEKENYGTVSTRTEQVLDGDGNTIGEKTIHSAGGNDLYSGDISFIIDIKPNDLTGNLTVKVHTGDPSKPLASVQIDTDNSNLLGKALASADKVFKKDNFTAKEEGGKILCTFSGLTLAENVMLNLTLDGTQQMREGAYLYTLGSNDFLSSQTFVGVAEGSRNVNLNVQMKFEAIDPNATVTNKSGTGKDEGQRTLQRTRPGQEITDYVTVDSSVSVKDYVRGTRVTAKTVTKNIREERKWNSYIEYLTTVTTGDGGGFVDDGGFGVNTGLTIPDEAVPLAAAPKTGDVSQIFAAVSLISLGASLFLKKKEF